MEGRVKGGSEWHKILTNASNTHMDIRTQLYLSNVSSVYSKWTLNLATRIFINFTFTFPFLFLVLLLLLLLLLHCYTSFPRHVVWRFYCYFYIFRLRSPVFGGVVCLEVLGYCFYSRGHRQRRCYLRGIATHLHALLFLLQDCQPSGSKQGVKSV